LVWRWSKGIKRK